LIGLVKTPDSSQYKTSVAPNKQELFSKAPEDINYDLNSCDGNEQA
jgi:hypothetical protein